MTEKCSHSAWSYNLGCRCEGCSAAKAAAKNIETRRAKGEVVCTRSRRSYQLGCHCPECTDANNRYRPAPSRFMQAPTTHFASAKDFAEAKELARQLKAKGFRNRASRVLLNLDGRWPTPREAATCLR